MLVIFRLQDAAAEDYQKKEAERVELREMVKRIDERTERFEHSCSCGGQP